MAQPFITERFLLQSDVAFDLYTRFAEKRPIIDYHCHLSPEEIAMDRRFENMTRIWLSGDHYKWRAMRACGVPERLITGDASDWEKFLAWAETVPRTLRNPLYHWTHMELKRPFGISDILLDGDTARRVWEECNARLQEPEFSTRGILRRMNVELVCTTDDPADSLEYHRMLREDTSFPVRVLPAFRADRAMTIERGEEFLHYLQKLGGAAGVEITSFARLLEALQRRHAFFHQEGCRLSDHGLEHAFAEEYSVADVEGIFTSALRGNPPDPAGARIFKSAILFELCLMDHAAGWAQQFHLGAIRNINPRMFRALGPDTGYDAIGDFPQATDLARLFAKLEERNALAKTIVYNLNPADNEILASLVGCFQDGSVAGKMQFGSAWWFLDQKEGMERQLSALSNMGLLGQFVGMLTDSRSFLSYPRHEYFRRILCNLLGNEMMDGLLPRDIDLVGGMIADISYHNARRYFDFW